MSALIYPFCFHFLFCDYNALRNLLLLVILRDSDYQANIIQASQKVILKSPKAKRQNVI